MGRLNAKKADFRPLSLGELSRLAKALGSMSLADSLSYAMDKYGLPRRHVESLRAILGYANTAATYKLTPAQREEIAEEYTDNDSATIQGLARKYNVRYNAIRSLLETRSIAIRNDHWTNAQLGYLRTSHRRGLRPKDMALALHRSPRSIANMIARMKKAGKL